MDTAPIRPWTCVVVAADSPLGRVGDAVNDLTIHLPDPDDPNVCPACGKDKFWPCPRFDAAAQRLRDKRLRVCTVVPLELHSRMPQPDQLDTPQWPNSAPDEENHRG